MKQLLYTLLFSTITCYLIAQPMGSEIRVNNYTTDNQIMPFIAKNLAGNTIIVWESAGQDGDGTGIFGQCFDSNGNKVGSEFQINTTTTGDQSKPSVAIDSFGNFVVIWESDGLDGNREGIFGQRFNAIAQQQGTEFQVNTTTNDDQNEARIAMNVAGEFVVVWQSFGQDGSANGIYGQRYTANGNTVGTEFQVNTTTSNEQQFPDIAIDDDGDFVVVWQSFGQDGDGWGIFGQAYNSSGIKVGATEFQVNTATTNYQEQAAIAMQGNGDFIVVWQSTNQVSPTSSADIYAQRYDASGNTVGSEFQVNTTYTSSGQTNPELTVDTAGNFIIIWDGSGTEDSQGIFAKEYDASGTAIDDYFLVNTNITSTQAKPQVAADQHGDYMIIWQGNQSGTDEVYAQAYFKGTGEEFQVNNTTFNSQDKVAIATDKAGNFVVVWDGNGTGDTRGIFGQRYDASGSKLGGEFLVNSNPSSFQQDNPDIAMDEDGDFVVVWESSGQDGSGYGVYGQRFRANGNKEGVEFKVNTITFGDQFDPAITMNDEGDFIVVWTSYNGADFDISGQRYDSGGAALGGEFTVNTVTTNNQIHPSIAMSESGNFVVAWENEQSFIEVYAQNFDVNANKVGSEFLVGITGNGSSPSVAMDTAGNFIIVWRLVDGSSSYIYGKYFEEGKTQGQEIAISSASSTFSKRFPSVSINKDGNFVVVWSSLSQVSGSSNYDIFGQRFNAELEKIGGEFQVNTYITSTQTEPDIVLCDNNDFIAVWESFAQDGSSYGVYGQRYENKFKTTARYYVDDSAMGNNSGGDWTNAFTNLSDAIVAAKKNDRYNTEIWVAEGTYFPQDSMGTAPVDNRERTFYFDFDVKLYGGFAGTPGTEGDFSTQSWQAYPTILSGDFAQDDPNDLMGFNLVSEDCRQENAYHVVYTEGVSDNFLADGFYIQGGNANGANSSSDPRTQGGGWLNRLDDFLFNSSNPVIENCHFSKNSSGFQGGAFYNIVTIGSSLVVEPQFINCIFDNNRASSGAAIYNNSTATASLAIVHVINSIFTRNSGGNSASCISTTSTNNVDELFVTNSSFTANKTINTPAVVSGVNVTIYNSIFHNNDTGFGSSDDITSFAEVYNSIVEGGWTGTGSNNLDADPLFIYPPDLDNTPFESGNLRLQACSPAINSGDNNAPDLIGITDDLDDNVRIYNSGTVDMGAYELQENFMSATTIICYRDLDSDTYGNPLDSAMFCTSCGTGFVSDNTDCNDDPQNGGATAFPNNPEICFDFIDNDCNGMIDETCCPTDTILYVNHAATGNNDGSDWTNALTDLQTALSFAKFADCNITTIWVAQGTYYPSLDKEGNTPNKNSRLATFFIDFDIELYGGFYGVESSVAERDWLVNTTTLSGDIGLLADSTDNAFHVISTEGFGNEIVVDGFGITKGHANSTDFNNRSGGAWENFNATISAKNCIFNHNIVESGGGALYSVEADANITNCTFHENTSVSEGGAIYFEYFDDFDPKTLTATNCAFWTNDGSNGGAIALRFWGFGFPQPDTSLYVTNCTFSDNTGTTAGSAAAIFFDDGLAYASVKNSILWGNNINEVSAGFNPIVVKNSIIEGGYGGAMNTDPLFVMPPDDLRLQSFSPAIDIGTNAYNNTNTDLDGNARIFNSTIDLGAYEYCSSQITCYRDLDGDTYGDSTVTKVFCTSCGMGYVLDDTDCNDDPNNGGAVAFPGNPEIMGDGIDNDCDGTIDESDLICEDVNLNITDDISNLQEHNAQKLLMADNTITAMGDATYTAGDSIILKVGFEAIGNFHAYIAECELLNIEHLENREKEIIIKERLSLEIFPNPLNYTAQIRFYVQKANDIHLTIFDTNGKLMRQIQLEQIEGWQEIELDAVNLPSGIYWLKLQTKEEILTRKFSVVKE